MAFTDLKRRIDGPPTGFGGPQAQQQPPQQNQVADGKISFGGGPSQLTSPGGTDGGARLPLSSFIPPVRQQPPQAAPPTLAAPMSAPVPAPGSPPNPAQAPPPVQQQPPQQHTPPPQYGAQPQMQPGPSGPYQQEGVGKYSGIQAPGTDYENAVLGGEYLDLKNNPWLQDYTAALRQEMNEEFQRTSAAAMSPFAAAGGTMGFSGIAAGMQGRMADDQSENVNNTIAGVYQGVYTTERELQNQIAAIQSGRTEALIGAQATIEAATKSANATKYAARLANSLGNKQLAADLWWRGEQLSMRAVELEQLAASRGYTDAANVQGMFGTSYGQNAPVDPFASAVQGGAGGGMVGYGFGDIWNQPPQAGRS